MFSILNACFGTFQPPHFETLSDHQNYFCPCGPHLISSVSFLQNQNHHFKPFKHLFLGYFIRNKFASPSIKTSPSLPLSSVKNYPALLLGICFFLCASLSLSSRITVIAQSVVTLTWSSVFCHCDPHHHHHNHHHIIIITVITMANLFIKPRSLPNTSTSSSPSSSSSSSSTLFLFSSSS